MAFPKVYDLVKSILTILQGNSASDTAVSALLNGTPTLGAGAVVSFDASVASSALSVGWYRISATDACWFTIGASPTAVADDAGSAFLDAGAIDFVYISDATYKIAAIKDSAAGHLSIQRYEVAA